MTVREYLGQVKALELRYKTRLNEIDRMRAELAPIRGLTYDNVHVQSSPQKSTQTELAIDRIVDAEAELVREIGEAHDKRMHIVRQIEAVEDVRYRELLILKYVDGLTLRAIGAKMGYSYEWVRKAHRQALRAFVRMNYKKCTPFYPCQ